MAIKTNKEINTQRVEDAIKTILEEIGEDITRDGLQETPKRVAKAYKELFEGYRVDDESFLNKTFETTYNDGMVTIENIPVYTFCEHHILPFFGRVTVTYKPNNGKVVGLSKINRLVRNCGRRLQTQEQLTDDIKSALVNVLNPQYVNVKCWCRHMCVEMRGVNHSGSETFTETTYVAPYQGEFEIKGIGEE